MKIIGSLLIGTLLLFSMESGWGETEPANRAPDVPNVTARTVQRGKRQYRSGSGTSVQTTTTIRSQGLEVAVSFFRNPSAPYEVECFFIARNEASNERFIYDAQVTRSQSARTTFEFYAPPLTGTIRRSVSIPISGTTGYGHPFTGTLYQSGSVSGSKTVGWVVRIISRGQVVRIESNQSYLRDQAKDNPTFFDAAFQ